MISRGQQDPGAHQLQLQPRGSRSAHLDQPGVDEVGGPRELGCAEMGGLLAHALELVCRMIAQDARGGVGDCRDDDEVAQPLEEVLGEPARIVARFDHLLDDAEHRGRVTGGERLDGVVEQALVGVAEQRDRQGVGHLGVARAGHQLVEDAERVTDRAPPRAYDKLEHARLHLHLLPLAERGEVGLQLTGRHQAERIVVGARPDGGDDLVGLGRGEDELHMLGRLLDELEQRVEAFLRDHVGLVDDVDLVPGRRRRVERSLAQVTGVVDSAVAGRVDLDDVETAGATGGQVLAGLADPAGRGRRTFRAVEAAREDAGTRGLAAASGPAEQVGVIGAVVAQGTLQRLGDVLLPDDVGERLGAIAAVQRLRHAATLARAADTASGRSTP